LKVRVRYFASLRELVGKREEVVEMEDVADVAGLLRILTDRHGEKFGGFVFDRDGRTVRRSLQFLVDGKNVASLEGLRTRVRDGSEFAILPPVGGGTG